VEDVSIHHSGPYVVECMPNESCEIRKSDQGRMSATFSGEVKLRHAHWVAHYVGTIPATVVCMQ
jgi:hypothetical protein